MSETTFEVVLLRKINRFPCIDVAREKNRAEMAQLFSL